NLLARLAAAKVPRYPGCVDTVYLHQYFKSISAFGKFVDLVIQHVNDASIHGKRKRKKSRENMSSMLHEFEFIVSKRKKYSFPQLLYYAGLIASPINDKGVLSLWPPRRFNS